MSKEQPLQNNNAIINIFKNKFASKVNLIYVNSLKKEVAFREVSVTEQKSLSKTSIDNQNRKDIIYDAQCALINNLCLDNDFAKLKSEAKDLIQANLPEELSKNNIDPASPQALNFISKYTNDFTQKYIADHTFDVYRLTEFDRIRLLMEIYQNNYFHQEIKYKCKECGKENKYELDFSKIIERFNEFDLTDKTYTVEDNKYFYNFILNYPTVRNVSLFYKSYAKNYKNAGPKERDGVDSIANVDYINLYIKQVELIDKISGEKNVADLTLMSYSETENFLALFPQNVIFSEEKGVLQYIVKNIMNKLNDVFQYEKCQFCGAETKEGMGNVIDFF